MNDCLNVQNLNKSFSVGLVSRRQVLHNVQFSVPEKTITGFVGVNGSGKTTTIKCLLRFIFPDRVEGCQLAIFGDKNLGAETRRRIGYLPERPYLPEHLTAKEFLHFHWSLAGLNSGFAETCTNILNRVGLPGVEKRRLHTFSKGMLQRVGLAQALLAKPDFLLLDEPMSGLDPDGRWLVKEIIREEHQRGATVFFSSHLLADMDELCSHLVVIDEGRIYFQGLVDDFLKMAGDLGQGPQGIESAFAKIRGKSKASS